MLNLYADLEMFTGEFLQGESNISQSDKKSALRKLEAAARQVDDYCGRHFFCKVGTYYFDGDGRSNLWLPMTEEGDLLSVTTLKVDEDADDTYELALTANTDYFLWPRNKSPRNRIDINPNSANISSFPNRARAVEIAGIWGYTQATENTGQTVQDNPLASGATEMTVERGGEFATGQTLLLESEQVYVSGINANKLTIARAVNGTTAAAHVQTTAISRYTYVSEIVEATLRQAGIDYQRRGSPASSVLQTEGLGTIRTFSGLDPGVKRLLDPYKLPRVG